MSQKTREKQARWYWKNHEKILAHRRQLYQASGSVKGRERTRVAHAVKRQWLDGMKDKPRMDCGGSFPPACMEFDHVRGKKLFCIGPSLRLTQQRVLTEIAKCDLVCANCHRIRTQQRRISVNR
jgi:hypothetical protein